MHFYSQECQVVQRAIAVHHKYLPVFTNSLSRRRTIDASFVLLQNSGGLQRCSCSIRLMNQAGNSPNQGCMFPLSQLLPAIENGRSYIIVISTRSLYYVGGLRFLAVPLFTLAPNRFFSLNLHCLNLPALLSKTVSVLHFF